MSLTLHNRLNFSTAPTEQASHIVLLASVKAAEQEKEKVRNPVDLVIVLDVSGSMAGGGKLDLCKRTLEFLMTQVTESDMVGLVVFDTTVRVAFPASFMTAVNKEGFMKATRALHPGSATNLSGGLFAGIEMLKKQGKAEVAAICLLTDGCMNNGITECAKLVSMTGKLIEAMDEEEGESVGGLLSSLARRFSASSTKKPRRAKPSVFTFGYGTDADVETLSSLADATGGSFYAIEHPESVPLSFADCLGGLTQVAAQNLEMTCEVSGGGEIETVLTMFPTERVTPRIVKIKIKDMYCGESRDILFKLGLPKGEAPVEASVSLTYVDTVNETQGAARDVARIQRSKGAMTSASGTGDIEVARHVVRLEAASEMEEARKEAEAGEYGKAQTRLEGVWKTSKERQVAYGLEGDALLTEVCDDLKVSSEGMASKLEYESKGRARTKGMVSSHMQQRSNKTDSVMAAGGVSRNAYATVAKKSMMLKSKTAFGYDE